MRKETIALFLLMLGLLLFGEPFFKGPAPEVEWTRETYTMAACLTGMAAAVGYVVFRMRPRRPA